MILSIENKKIHFKFIEKAESDFDTLAVRANHPSGQISSTHAFVVERNLPNDCVLRSHSTWTGGCHMKCSDLEWEQDWTNDEKGNILHGEHTEIGHRTTVTMHCHLGLKK